MIARESKDLRKRFNSKEILDQFTVPYGMSDNSRYKHIDQLLLDDNKLIHATLSRTDLSVFPHEGLSTYEVTEADRNRLDIVAYKIYGAASLWWILAYTNSLEDPFELPLGLVLYYPPLSSLRTFPNPLS